MLLKLFEKITGDNGLALFLEIKLGVPFIYTDKGYRTLNKLSSHEITNVMARYSMTEKEIMAQNLEYYGVDWTTQYFYLVKK